MIQRISYSAMPVLVILILFSPVPCKAGLLYGPAVPVTALNSSSSDVLTWLSSDGLTAVLYSNRLSTFDLFSATRASLTSPFSSPTTFPFNTVNNSTFNTADGVLSADGLELFYHSANSSTGISFFRAVRPNLTSQFSAGSQVTTVPTTPANGFNRPFWINSDGNRLYYQNDGGQLKLATRTSPITAFAPSTFDPFTSINLSGNAFSGSLTPDELTLFFYSSRAGGLGGYDIWYATRSDTSSAFNTPLNLTSLNTSGGDGVPVVFGNQMYLNRDGDIFVATEIASVPEPSTAFIIFLLFIAIVGTGPLSHRRKKCF